jgi:hypothetical protein
VTAKLKSGAVTFSVTFALWARPSRPVPVIVRVAMPPGVFVDVVTVIVELPPGVTDVGLNTADVPEGSPVADNVTASAKPLSPLTATVYELASPGFTEAVIGVGDIVKSGPETTSVTFVECVSDPLVPVIVIVELPMGVPLVVVTLNVELPAVVMVGFEKEAVAPAGSPLAASVTVPLNPPSAPAFTV